jgi:phage recombination protein Bet
LLTQEDITIIKNSIAKGASDEELKFCLTVARRYKLDPFKQQIWFVKRWDSGADNGKGGKGAHVWTPQVGINGLMFSAARDHKKDFGSVGLPEYGPMHDAEWTDNGKLKKFKAPEWARVKVWKRGASEPTEAQVWWDEYAPAELGKAPFWRKMPRRMLGKCATALAIREAYPDLGGLYIPEEMERMGEEYTESGRQIIEGVPAGGSKEAAQAVGARVIQELQQKIAARQTSPSSTAPEGVGPVVSDTVAATGSTLKKKIISIAMPSDAAEAAHVFGDLDENIVQVIKGPCMGIKLEDKDIYVIPISHVVVLEAACQEQGYGYQEVSGLPSPSLSQKEGSKAAENAVGNPSEKGVSLTPDTPTAIIGTIQAIRAKQKAKKPNAKEHYQLVISDQVYFCYRTTLWPILDQLKPGMEVEFFIKDRVLNGFKKANGREFDADGITPIIQNSEPRPAAGRLFV